MGRLPIPGQDDGVWGDILNDYLLESHKSDGTLKDNSVDGGALANNSVSEAALNVTNSPSSGEFLSWNGSGLAWAAGAGGITDHGDLTGLTDDDHVQYHNNTRGDARYYTHAQVDTALADKADLVHTHAIADITNLQTALDGKSDTSHNHDSRYYTESEIDTALAGKSSTSHSHTLGDLSDVSTSGATDGQVLKYNGGSWGPAADDGGGGGGANLTSVPSANQVVITSDSGTDATIASANSSDAGVLTAADKSKLDGIEDGAEANDVDSVAGKTGVVTLVKGDVGLGNVDNTSDLNKPVSTATQAAIDAHVNDASAAHAASAVSFSPTGTIAATTVQAAIAEVAAEASTGDPTMGGDLTGTASNAQIASGAIINADINASAAIAQSKVANLTTDLASKEPTITAGTTAQYWRGDKTWQTLNKSSVGLGNVDNTADADKPISDDTQTALDLKADADSSLAFIMYSGASYPNRSTVTSDTSRVVVWIGPVAPGIGGNGAVDDVDIWWDTSS